MDHHLANCDCALCRMQCVPITLTADTTQTTYVLGRIILPTIPAPPMMLPGPTPAK
mgnify:CR=1 FL=1